MAKLLNDGLSWIRRSISEHDNVRETKSAPVTNQSSEDHQATLEEEDEEEDSRQRKARCISTSGYPLPDLVKAYDLLEDAMPSASSSSLVPEVEGESQILSLDEILSLTLSLPTRLTGCSWRLVFTTESDGYALSNVYRRCEGERNPALVVIRDVEDNRFGAFLSDPLRLSEKEEFFGTGQTFLFKLGPRDLKEEEETTAEKTPSELSVYKWTTHNDFFINCSQLGLFVGSGEGKFGLTVDGNLDKGRSQKCLTFDNEPLSPSEDFQVKMLEVWTFDN